VPVITAELATPRELAELSPIVSDFYGIHTWCSWITDTTRDETRPDTRVATMTTGTRVVEELIESGPTFVRYRMDDDPNSPIRDYEAELRVSSADGGGSLLTWSVSFACDPAMEGPLTANIQGTCQRGLEELAQA
jgi:hypothetical protein